MPIVALITDFGARDHFVGVVKGVVLDRCPAAQLVDLAHELEPGDVTGGALLLWAAAPYFPATTVFLAVVDPGVGGARRPLCLVAGGRRFVGPDNGLLWPAAARFGAPQAFLLADPRYRLPAVSATFHGRDLFAPAAAALAAGVEPAALGPPVPDPVRLEFPRPRATATGVDGEILWVDRFGNLISNLAPADLDPLGPGPFTFTLGTYRIAGPVPAYSAVAGGEPCVVLSSFGTFEVAVRDGNAARELAAGRGDPLAAAAGQ
jgi:S-adenosylmethionine hydrolase